MSSYHFIFISVQHTVSFAMWDLLLDLAYQVISIIHEELSIRPFSFFVYIKICIRQNLLLPCLDCVIVLNMSL